MSVALATAPNVETLDDLAARANREHQLVIQAAEGLVEHAYAAGEALTVAKSQLPHGQWKHWLDVNWQQSYETATLYMRIYRYRDLLEGHRVSSIGAARRVLTFKPNEASVGGKPEHVALRKEAKRLCDAGMTQREVAELLGVTQEQVTYWINPSSYRKRLAANKKNKQRAAKARKALRRAEAEKHVRKTGGPIAEAYALVRRALQALEQAEEQSKADARKAVGLAMHRLHDAEDAIVKASKLS